VERVELRQWSILCKDRSGKLQAHNKDADDKVGIRQ
jgi:hypothetical protein